MSLSWIYGLSYFLATESMTGPGNAPTHHPATPDGENGGPGQGPSVVEGIRVLIDWKARSGVGAVVVTTIFASLLGAIVVAPVLSLSGFCFSEARFLSDDQYIDAAISRIIELPSYQMMTPVAQCVHPIHGYARLPQAQSRLLQVRSP